MIEFVERDPLVIVAVGPVEALLLPGALLRLGRSGRRARIRLDDLGTWWRRNGTFLALGNPLPGEEPSCNQ
jgi:hypothetical protein